MTLLALHTFLRERKPNALTVLARQLLYCGDVGQGKNLLMRTSRGVKMVAFVATPALPAQAAPAAAACHRRPAWMGPWKKGEKDDAFLRQQDILARRRDAKRNKEYFSDVEKRRRELENYYKERQLVVPEGEDPLIAWQALKDKGLLGEVGYPEEEEGGVASGGIPMPMASFGIPKVCNARFTWMTKLIHSYLFAFVQRS
jgi:hypothetical protein